ncbi:MAG TPA: hypothetical protein P5133_13230 [Spirochaetia bacterium]|nr:hypothetical protein [Spirochaetia bacterium]HRZ65888.1 hypothetical protein [Spirochaetia bacterium]
MPRDEAFSLDLDLRSALGLYLFLEAKEEELTESPASLLASLKAYLYERLSIEEMERPRDLLASLDARPGIRPGGMA